MEKVIDERNMPMLCVLYGRLRKDFDIRNATKLDVADKHSRIPDTKMAANVGSISRNYTDIRLCNEPYPYSYSYRATYNEDANSLKDWCNDVRVFFINAYERGRSDPRQFIFAAKAGLAFAIVSVLIFFKEPLHYISQYCIWSILTVIIVFEFSIGAILSKGINIALGMFSSGVLALGVGQLSIWAGDECQEIVIVVSIFITGSLASYVKLYPSMKAYDYGFRVFTFIFCVLLMSGTSNFAQIAVSRLALIGVGLAVCLVVNVFIYPNWAGEDLQNLVVNNFRGVATSLEGCVNYYLQQFGYERIPSKILVYQASDDPVYSGYRSAVQSSSEEEALLGFAVWEPPHGRYKMLRYPWSNYVKVSGALRHCAFTVMAMHGCILAEIQADAKLRNMFQNEIQKVGTEGAKVLRELGSRVEKMEKLNPDIDLLDKVHEAAEELQMKVDENSYHLVNSGKWASGRRPKTIEEEEDPDIFQELQPSEIKPPKVLKSLSEAYIDLNPKPPLPVKNRIRTAKTISNHASMMQLPSAADVLKNQQSSVDVLKNQPQWPSRISIHGDMIINEREVKTRESASALSLANFTTLLIEFVARLQNLVSEFEELSRKAKFSEPVNSVS
ncbi:hypothetical protein LXL04_035422 [Taraxacum kok-saghyz]